MNGLIMCSAVALNILLSAGRKHCGGRGPGLSAGLSDGR